MELIGELIRKRRQAQRKTQEELAKSVGVARSYLSQIERLNVLPSEKVAVEIAKALDEEPKKYLDAIQKERIVVKERSARIQSELSNRDYLLSQTKRTFWYRGYSAAFLVIGSFERLIHLLNRGGTVQFVLSEPNEQNLYKRALEHYRVSEESIEHIMRRMEQERWKLMHTLMYLEELYRDHQEAGLFRVLLDPEYEPKRRVTIVDNEYALVRQVQENGGSRMTFDMYTRLDPEFAGVEAGFLEASERARPIVWENWRKQYRPYDKGFITKDRIEALITQFPGALERAVRNAEHELAIEQQPWNGSESNGKDDTGERFIDQLDELGQLLTEPQLRTLLLHYAGYSYAEIGGLMEISRQGAAKHFNAAVCRLKKC